MLTSSKRRTKLHSIHLLRSGLCRPHPPRLVSKKDHNSAELETVKISKNPTTMTANGEVQTREASTVNVKELDLFVTVMLLEETPAVLSLGKPLRRSWVNFTTGPSGQKATSHQKWQKYRSSAKKRTTCRSLSLSSSTSSSPASSTSSSKDIVISTEIQQQEEVRL